MNSSCALNWRGIAYSTAVISLTVILGIQPARAQLDDGVRRYVQAQESPGLVDSQIAVASQELQRLSAIPGDNPTVNTDANAINAEPDPISSSPTAATTGEASTSPNPSAANAEPTADMPKADAPHPLDTSQTTPQAQPKPYLDIYGFAQLDLGYDFKVNDPNWFDVNRPSKLPSTPGQFGRNGNIYFSVRQTRFGVEGSTPTDWGELKAKFEFDMFGVGKDAGNTTIRPRHYYGQLGPILAGQTNSTFMDVDVFPNVLDYWGPNGMVFLRLPQLRWMPIRGDTHLWFALEQPGQSGDQGVLSDRIEVQNIKARFKLPDFSAQLRLGGKKGYFQVAGVARNVKLDDNLPDQFNLDQSIWAGGVNLSAKAKIRKDSLHLQYVVGDGIENYMNDAPFDVAPILNPGHPTQPIKGKPLPMWSYVVYLDHSWGERWATSLGYSALQVQNTSLQAPNAFHKGRYATINLLYSAFEHLMYGGEFQWARRDNMSNGFSPDDYRIQLSFKYNFKARVLGEKP